MRIKWLRQRRRADGSVFYVIDPPKHVRSAVGAQFVSGLNGFAEAKEKAQALADQYAAWLAAQAAAERPTLRRVNEGSVAALIRRYKRSRAYLDLRASSRASYDILLDTAEHTIVGGNGPFGDLPAKFVTPELADQLYDSIKSLKGDHRAFHVVKVLKRVWNVGLRYGAVSGSPFAKMGISALPPRVVLWEPEHVEALYQASVRAGWRSVGLMAYLCYDLCQRPGDVRKLRWEQIQGDVACIVQEKTGAEVWPPLSPRLKTLLDETPRHESGYVVIDPVTQAPYNNRLFNKRMNKLKAAAGLPANLQMRDLRRTGLTETAEAGCTDDELRAISGHKTRDVVSIYVRPTKKLAANAISKRFGAAR